jgi:anti-sigma regulatory factor (Ser/Thr protein kinase)
VAAEGRFRQDRESLARPSGTPGGSLEFRLALDVPATTDAREAVAAWLGDAVAPSVLDHCKLLVSELVTNSVRHSGMPADEEVVVRVDLTRDSVRLEVGDPGCSGTVAPRTPDIQTGGGFGLNLVQMISEKWGVERSAREGTRVWAVLARAPDEMFDASPDR